MRPNVLIAAAFTLLVTLFIYSCANEISSSKVPDDRELRDYPVGDSNSAKSNTNKAN